MEVVEEERDEPMVVAATEGKVDDVKKTMAAVAVEVAVEERCTVVDASEAKRESERVEVWSELDMADMCAAEGAVSEVLRVPGYVQADMLGEGAAVNSAVEGTEAHSVVDTASTHKAGCVTVEGVEGSACKPEVGSLPVAEESACEHEVAGLAEVAEGWTCKPGVAGPA